MTVAKPQALAVQFASIPAELKALNCWVLWRYVLKTSKKGAVWTKVPFTVNGTPASSTNSSTWDIYINVENAYLLGDFDGLGIVINDTLFHGIDIDDCINEQGEINTFAQEILERVQGYAEISPSKTGLKIFTKTNLQHSNVKKELELYTTGRYFTVTGNVLPGRDQFVHEVQDIAWLVKREFDEQIIDAPEQAADAYLLNAKPILSEWDLDRVRDEVLLHVSPECNYADWIAVGMALHHQGLAEPEWLELWDDWSRAGSTYVEGECERKWESFSKERATGRGPKTLRYLLDLTKETRAQKVAKLADDFRDQIAKTTVVNQLETVIAKKIAKQTTISDVDREQLARDIQSKAAELQQKIPIGTVRGWLRPRLHSDFPDLNEDGTPKSTVENLDYLLRKMNTQVRYNVMSKQIEILIANEGFSQDNHYNAALARITSEAGRHNMSTKNISLFLICLADRNPFNPMLQWLQSKPWDGVSRLDELAATIESSMDPSFKKTLLIKWLKQAVAAAVEPNGIAAQGVLVFQGDQYKGKTRWFQSLVGDRQELALTGHTLDVKSKDSVLIAIAHWLVELGELDATFTRSDISALKSHITQDRDTIRRPYAPAESIFARRTVYFASVNERRFLHDPTGNRRYWVIPVTSVNHNHGLDMQQVWAEMLVLYRKDKAFYLTQAEMEMLNRENGDFSAIEPIEERITGAFDWHNDPKWVWATATDVLIRCGIQNPVRSQTTIAGRVIRKLNGGQERRSGGRNLLAIPQDRLGFSEFAEELAQEGNHVALQ